VQAALNARAYCRNFDDFTESQQMAVTQLVYQMGVNLEQFTQFRALINLDVLPEDGLQPAAVQQSAISNPTARGTAYWDTVQRSLTQSQWARLYRTRAIAVIAMLDPNYAENPSAAERKVSAILRPAVIRRSRSHAKPSATLVSGKGKRAKPAKRNQARATGKEA